MASSNKKISKYSVSLNNKEYYWSRIIIFRVFCGEIFRFKPHVQKASTYQRRKLVNRQCFLKSLYKLHACIIHEPHASIHLRAHTRREHILHRYADTDT